MLSVVCGTAAADELGLNIYGLSYHFERAEAKAQGLDNEINPGLGARWRFHESTRLDWFADAGIYRDSGRNTAFYTGAGVFYKATRNLRAGAGLAVFYSDSYNDGDPFVAPLPLLAYDWRAVTFNMGYAPKISGINDINTLSFWLTVWPKRQQ